MSTTPYDESMAEWQAEREWEQRVDERDEIEARVHHESMVEDDHHRDDGQDDCW